MPCSLFWNGVNDRGTQSQSEQVSSDRTRPQHIHSFHIYAPYLFKCSKYYISFHILTRWPTHLASTHHMEVKVIDRLRPILTIVDGDAKAIGALFLPHLLGDEHQMTQQFFLILSGISNLCQSIPDLGNDQKVDRGLGRNVRKGQTLVIFMELGRVPLAADNVIKYCIRTRSVILHLFGGFLSLLNFVRHVSFA